MDERRHQKAFKSPQVRPPSCRMKPKSGSPVMDAGDYSHDDLHARRGHDHRHADRDCFRTASGIGTHAIPAKENQGARIWSALKVRSKTKYPDTSPGILMFAV